MDCGRLKKRLEGFFMDFYEESFFDFKTQYETGKVKDYQKMTRLVDYIFRQGYTVAAGKTNFQIPVHTQYRGIELSGIHGEADMVLRMPKGTYLAVMIETGKPKYSYHTKNESTQSENAVELICLYLGLCKRYGSQLETAIFYLKNKDDRGDQLVSEYEHRRGRNVINGVFLSEQDAWNRLFHAVAISTPSDCGACRFRDVCRTVRLQNSQITTIPEPGPLELTGGEKKLTKAQEEVVNHKDGPLCVIAVPGAGKTHSLVERLVHLIRKEKVNPAEILFLTFTQKAAGEIRNRVTARLGTTGEQPGIFTFHALAYSILREHPESVCGVFRLATKVDRYRLIEAALKGSPLISGVSYDGITGQYGLLAVLDKAFQHIDMFGESWYISEYTKKKDVDGILAVYRMFQGLYQKEKFISYDDQISMINELFEEKPGVRKKYQKKYQYVMVDEFQDISEDQVQMVYQIAEHGNLVVVGDDDQTIFKWRGGSSQYMLDFTSYWKGARQITMQDNFRSVNTVLEAADSIICRNTKRFAKQIQAHSFTDIKPRYLSQITAGEIYDVVRRIMEQGYEAGDIAIIARKNKDLTILEEHLLPYVEVLPSRKYLIQDAVFVLLHDILNMYYRGILDRSLYRYLCCLDAAEEIPAGVMKIGTLHDFLCKKGLLVPIDWKDVNCLPVYRSRFKESKLMNAGYTLIQIFKEIQYGKSVQEVLHEICQILYPKQSHLVTDILEEIAKERLIRNMEDMLSHMDDMLRYYDETEIEYPRRPEAVNLLTGHKAKGKEYPAVIIYNVDSFEDTPEDRCLLYVAMTRAEKLLYITQAPYTNAQLLKDFAEQVEVEVKRSQVG